MLRNKLLASLAVAALLASAATASVRPGALQRTHDPDWPCIQVKVPELSVVAVWTGPPIEEALQRWDEDAQVAALVRELSQRRLPLDEANARATAFAEEVPAGARDEKLLMLFAGLFETLDRERKQVIAGIIRYARKQTRMAEEIRADQARLSDLNAGGGDPQQVEALTNQLVWETRVFNERRESLTFVCEVPTIIEQRLFALGRTIAAALPN